MNDRHLIKTSKYLSKHLRHTPETLGLTLAPGGWVAVDELLAACARNNVPISRADLNEVVARNDKQRFSFDETGTRIRANQGHSVEIDLHLEPRMPPDTLYHGTGRTSVDAIKRMGLKKMNRHHVHLSSDRQTAENVGARHGQPVVLTVEAKAMYEAGYVFYRTENGVWLVECVPPAYLTHMRTEDRKRL